jgi:hypothetical protein
MAEMNAASRSFQPSRRAVLGAGAVVTAGLALSPSRTDAAKAAGARHVTFRAWRGSELAAGEHNGTVVSAAGLVLGSPAGSRSYTDPYGNGTAVAYDVGTWTSPVVNPGHHLTELVASWNADTPDGTWIEVLVRGTAEDGTLTGWYILGRWASDDPQDGGALHRTSVSGQGTAYATVYVDTLATLNGHLLRSWQLQVQLMRPAGSPLTPTVGLVGAMASQLPDVKTVPVSAPGTGRGITLNVPTLSQEVHTGHYPQWDNGGEAWCSPTSTAMVVGYWGTGPTAADTAWVDPPVDAVVDYAARNVFDYAYDGAGNWPFNPAYAARFGLEAFVTRLRSLTEAERFIAAGIPLVASVSFKKSKLTGAGYGTNGHLLVICGFTSDGNVVVNDPASHLIPDDAQVRVVYDRAEFENTWVPHSGGLVYVIHPTGHPLPPAPAEANW